jgi:hypothetical protein
MNNVVWGASGIAREIGLSRRATFHLLEAGRLPAKKVGGRWVAHRESLNDFFKVKRFEDDRGKGEG